MNKSLKAWLAGCGVQALITLAASAFILCSLLAIALAVLFVPLPAPYEDDRFLIFAGSFVLWMALFMAGVVGAAVVVIRRRARQLDAAFCPLGLKASSYLINGRQYHGQYRGRRVDVYFYRGPILDIYLAAPFHTRMGIATPNALDAMASFAINPTSRSTPATRPIPS